MNNLHAIYLLPARLRYFLIALICMIIVIFVYWQDILPLKRAFAVSQQQEKQLIQQLQKLSYQEMSLEEKMAQLPETKMMLSEWQKKFIKHSDVNKLLKEIISISKRDKLQVKLFDAAPVSQENRYLKQPLKIILVGEYAQTTHFIEQIAHLPWTVVVESFALSRLLPDKTSRLFLTELELNVYTPHN